MAGGGNSAVKARADDTSCALLNNPYRSICKGGPVLVSGKNTFVYRCRNRFYHDPPRIFPNSYYGNLPKT